MALEGGIMKDISLYALSKKYTSEEIAKELAKVINIITLKRSVQIAEMSQEERVGIMNKLVKGLEEL